MLLLIACTVVLYVHVHVPLFLLTFLLSCRQCVRGCGQFPVGGAPTTDKEDYYKCPIYIIYVVSNAHVNYQAHN